MRSFETSLNIAADDIYQSCTNIPELRTCRSGEGCQQRSQIHVNHETEKADYAIPWITSIQCDRRHVHPTLKGSFSFPTMQWVVTCPATLSNECGAATAARQIKDCRCVT